MYRAAGYAWYRDDCEQYVRIGVLSEDFDWDTRTETNGGQEQDPISLEWAKRLGFGNNWWPYSDRKAGSDFERTFPDATALQLVKNGFLYR